MMCAVSTPPTAQVLAVNVGPARDEEWAGKLRRTAIDKRPVTGPVGVAPTGVEGDEIADLVNHGGADQAVYAYAREDLDHWETSLGGPVAPGMFGENLTTVGIDVNAALVGERWQVGEPGTGPLLEVADVRIPCRVFANWLGERGLDDRAWVKRFADAGRPGPYLRVLEPGIVSAGDPLRVVHRPDHDLSIVGLFRALTTERDRLPRLLEVPALGARARAMAETYLERHPAAADGAPIS